MKKQTINTYGKNISVELNSIAYSREEFKLITGFNYGNDNECLHYEFALLDCERLKAIITVEVRSDSKTCKLHNFRNMESWFNESLYSRIKNACNSLSQRSLIKKAD